MSAAVQVCKVEGCDEPAAATRGVYALLCAGHAAERRQGRVSSGNGHTGSDWDNLVMSIVLDFEERVETALDLAAAEFKVLMRKRLEA